ncbi:bifunctional Delta(1)-pyrroline-2-carboxylate/Delta(1)-piperideine-2-carboxylate reductase [Ilumatobacter coccineus]|uniref:Ornithine cyclodeaminase/mu-crystallin family protein n=1 Tax=Ilumatobacter coccineus (strain NBRC 103263 / KCTC 29153 / YM16-304) TaxID=1313172 RepID=A0A6C7E5X1_ILUCY|nr:ornithine cyclodeaminase family protein [Ilumatobacter coccineus]BAN02197.1 ornithine cyclodeaminase/mu-crystallin family protein [Ilumatobacter coccineus YM16-304]
MQFFEPAQVADALPWLALVEAIEHTVADPGARAPERTVHPVATTDGTEALLLLKPGWVIGDVIAVKVATFFPDNGARDLPTVNAGVVLFSGVDGTMIGACDGNELTTRRTAAASAVAAKRLVRHDAQRLLVVGTGALAPMVAAAHCSVHDYASVEVWGRNDVKAAAAVETARRCGVEASVCADLDAAVAAADVISCVTASTTPLVRGSLLRPGTHVDLIGSFTPEMRETDDDVIRRGAVWVDSYDDGVLAGDLAQPLAAGVLHLDEIRGDLRELIVGDCPARDDDDQITVFKSAGIALEDVAAARLVFGSS